MNLSSQWKLYQRGFGVGGLDSESEWEVLDARDHRQGRQQQEDEETSQWKFCGKGPGWAWVTPTWEARIKTSDLSSEAKGPLAWFTLVKPSCCKQQSAGEKVQWKFNGSSEKF